MSGALAIQYKGGVMLWPIAVDGTYITSPYGNRLHPIQGVYRYHDGIDIGNEAMELQLLQQQMEL